jgi:Flp pilus assembly protein TadD
MAAQGRRHAAVALVSALSACVCGGCHREYLAPQRPEPITASALSRTASSNSGYAGGIQLAEARIERPDATEEVPENLRRAQDELNAGRPAQAAHFYERVLRDEPGHVVAHHRLAVIADQVQDFPAAERHYRAALLGRPGDPTIRNDLGYSYLLQGRLAEAERVLRETISASGPNERAVTNLALLYTLTGDQDRALEVLAMTAPDRATAVHRLQRLIARTDRDDRTRMFGTPNRSEAADALPAASSLRRVPSEIVMTDASLDPDGFGLPEIRPAENRKVALNDLRDDLSQENPAVAAQGLPLWGPAPQETAAIAPVNGGSRSAATKPSFALPPALFDARSETVEAPNRERQSGGRERPDVITMIGHSHALDELSESRTY